MGVGSALMPEGRAAAGALGNGLGFGRGLETARPTGLGAPRLGLGLGFRGWVRVRVWGRGVRGRVPSVVMGIIGVSSSDVCRLNPELGTLRDVVGEPPLEEDAEELPILGERL